MKIFATSDIHGNIEIMNKLRASIANELLGVELIVFCGDAGARLGDIAGQQRDIANLRDVFQGLGIECRFVRGNIDGFTPNGKFYLNAEEEIAGESFVPFESILKTPFGTHREVDEEQMHADLQGLGDCCGKIIVAHNPPFGAVDKVPSGANVGSHSIADWITKNAPKIWLCGHVHESFGESKIGETLVLNCACDNGNDLLRGWLVDTETLIHSKVCV
ncbi:MAG: metallophosphoesterase family protein [Clostridiales bacterium]|jgi:Icc-related predicted phosphoesterase|nr:metallophosphoesterase family protein [Clostridiales bacterium]